MGDQSVIIRGGTGTFTGRVLLHGSVMHSIITVHLCAYDQSGGYSPLYTKPIVRLFGKRSVRFCSGSGLYCRFRQVPMLPLLVSLSTLHQQVATQVDLIDNNFKMHRFGETNLAFDFKTQDQWNLP